MDSRRMCPQCRAFITTKDKICPYCNTPVAPRAVDLRSPISTIFGSIPQARFASTTILLINIGMFIATYFLGQSLGQGQALAVLGGSQRGLVFNYGQWWRLLTAGFLHGGIFHIFMNMWVLFDLGPQVEEVYGTARFLVIYTVATVLGFLASALWSTHLSVGASAALFGLIGAMIALGVRNQTSVGRSIRSMYVRWAIYGLIFSFLPGIDMAAHVGGLAGGFVVGWLAGLPAHTGAVGEKVWRFAAGFCVAIAAVCFLQMILQVRAAGT